MPGRNLNLNPRRHLNIPIQQMHPSIRNQRLIIDIAITHRIPHMLLPRMLQLPALSHITSIRKRRSPRVNRVPPAMIPMQMSIDYQVERLRQKPALSNSLSSRNATHHPHPFQRPLIVTNPAAGLNQNPLLAILHNETIEPGFNPIQVIASLMPRPKRLRNNPEHSATVPPIGTSTHNRDPKIADLKRRS